MNRAVFGNFLDYAELTGGPLPAPRAKDMETNRGFTHGQYKEHIMGRGILLWLIGVPIPIIILLALFWH
jgi:hypothetical protein